MKFKKFGVYILIKLFKSQKLSDKQTDKLKKITEDYISLI